MHELPLDHQRGEHKWIFKENNEPQKVFTNFQGAKEELENVCQTFSKTCSLKIDDAARL